MPSVSQTTVSPISGKKRRRDNGDGAEFGVHVKISSPRHVLHDTVFHIAANRDDSLHLNPERKQLAPRGRLHEQKRQRIDTADTSSRETHSHTDWQTRRDEEYVMGETGDREVAKSKIDLSPCHVCWRKPTEKSQLDSYAYCEECGKRACYICMRECEGSGILEHKSTAIGEGTFSFEFDGPVEEGRQSWQAYGGEEAREVPERVWDRERIVGHRCKICSRCCVERGTDGEVWCLGCLKAEGVS